MQRAAQAYLETQITTTSQGQLLVMLYDGAVKFLVQAKERMDAKDYAEKGNLISKALDVINELDSTLNTEKGGQLAENLHQLYFYCSKRLFTANCKMDQTPIDEVIKILGGLRSAYAQIIDQPQALAAAEQAAAAQRQTAAVPHRNLAGGSGAPLNAGSGHSGPVRAREAYAQQGARPAAAFPPAPPARNAAGQSAPDALPAAASPAPRAEEAPSAGPQESAAPLTPSPVPARRLAASALYGKFASYP